jgi:Rieske 2Fe-2S family protein
MNSAIQKRNAHGALSLAAEYYCSTDIWQQEQARIFQRNWIYVGHQSEWPETRSFRTLTVGDYPILIWRGTDGQLRAFHNVCRHRGAVLAKDACGRLDRDHCVCPYHGWSYASDGRLAGAPNMADVANFDRIQWGLKPAPLRCEQGLVFVCAEEPHADSTTAWQRLALQLASWRIADLVRGARLQYEVRANWKVIFENYSECYHCPLVHPALNRLTPYSESSNSFETGAVLGGPMRLAAGIATMSEEGHAVGAPLPGLDATQRQLVYYYTLFPTCFVSLHPDYVMIHRLEPRAVGVTHIECDFWVMPELLTQSHGLDSAVRFWDLTNRQDWEVCERVQRGVSSPAYQPGPLSHLESIVAAFDRHYLQSLGT